MRHLFFKQSGMTILFQTKFGVELYGFKESRLVYAVDDDDEDEFGLTEAQREMLEKAEKDAAGKKGKSKEQKKIEALQKKTVSKVTFVDSALTQDSERHRAVVDRFIQELPVDINPADVLKAKEEIERKYSEKEVLFQGTKKEIESYVTVSGKQGEEAKKLEDEIGKAFFRVVPTLYLDQIRKKAEMGLIKPEQVYHPLRVALYRAASHHVNEGEKVDQKKINDLAKKLSENVLKFVENEQSVIEKLELLKRAMIGIHDNLMRKETEKRLILNAERSLGFTLKEGVTLNGLDVKWVRNNETGNDEFIRRRKKWIVMKPDIDKTVSREGEAKIILRNVIVNLQDSSTQEIISLPLNKMREFIFTYDITPQVKNKTDLFDKVDYLSRMGIKLNAGDELEFDHMERDPETQEIVPKAHKVKIVSINNKEVILDKEVLYRAKWDSYDIADHEYKSKMTLGEFSRWLNVRHAIPTMTNEQLKAKMQEQYEYLNNTYNRSKDCHRPVEISKGEVIYAEASGTPMYEIMDVQPETVEVRYGESKRRFTNTQFLRWIFENDLEPYDPILQKLRAERYLKVKGKEAEQVKKDSEDIVKYFKEGKFWRDSKENLAKINAGLINKDTDPEIQSIQPLDAHQHSNSGLAEFWRDTKFISFHNIFEIFKNYKEFYHHHWERDQKDRFSSVGKGMPFYGAEFERINNEAEAAEVDHLKKNLKEMPPPAIWQVLLNAHSKDELKACIETLCEKGKFRWDDPRVWSLINHFNSQELQIPIPEPGNDPYQPYKAEPPMWFNNNPVAGKTGFDLLPEAIDGLWGDSTFTGWKRNNENTLDEGCKKAYNKGRELESDPRGTGGVRRELEIMLEKHMKGIYFEGSDYEGLLRYIIEQGKIGADDKVYFLLMGLTVPNKAGRTIMSWDRLSYFIDQFSNQFPALDYFNDKGAKRIPGTDEMYWGPWRKSHFTALTKKWTEQAKTNNNFGPPPGEVDKFLNEEILSFENVQTRIEKAATTNPEKIDHDDWPLYGAALKDNAIDNLCILGSRGQRISTQAFKNFYMGYGPRLQALAYKYETEKNIRLKGKPGTPEPYYQKLMATLSSYVRFNSITNKRYNHDDSKLFNFSNHDLNSIFGGDPTHKLVKYRDDLDGFLKSIIDAYNPPNRKEKLDVLFLNYSDVEKSPVLKGLQNDAVKNFSRNFEEMIKSDKGEKMIRIITKKEFLHPLGGKSPQEKFKNQLKAYLTDTDAGQMPSVDADAA